MVVVVFQNAFRSEIHQSIFFIYSYFDISTSKQSKNHKNIFKQFVFWPKL